MGMGVDRLWVGVDVACVGGRYIMGRCVHIQWVVGRYASDSGVKMPWEKGSIYHV